MAPSTKSPGGAAAGSNTTQSNNKIPQPASNGVITASNSAPGGATVNRKKQKRRQKLAARQASTHGQHDPNNDLSLDDDHDYANGYLPSASAHGQTSSTQPPDPNLHYVDQSESTNQHYAYSDEDYDAHTAHLDDNEATKGQKKNSNKKKKKKKTTAGDVQVDESSLYPDSTSSQAPPPPPPPPPPSDDVLRTVQRRINKDPIWDTSSQEERSRIKDFWLSLGEEERKSLVKIEKEAVLRKMKEQQKHSCSCTVCGRKRTAIEEELEVLYDAYYEELEQFANHNQQLTENGTNSTGSNPSVPYPHPLSRPHTHRHASSGTSRKQTPGRIQEIIDDADGLEAEEADEDYSDDDYEDEDYSGDETDELPPGAATDFFTFGNSLTVKGGILTVADDLLKNDGQKFIDMMEQLAERRMQREEEAQYTQYLPHPSLASQHNHGGHSHPPDDDEYDDEEEDDYDSQDEEYDEDDEMDTMTEEQRMEEGRRMFQIFAARMFEQRVLTAYREKTSREKADKLIQELAEEQEATSQQNAKKAREAEKKKQKKQQQKQKQAEEKARKEAEKAAADAAIREAEEKKQEEARKRREEQKKKKEAERKAQEEERLRKEAERVKRQEAERERQQEAERRAREAKAEEKRRKEEAKKKEREEREAKEKEAREKKAREEQERREKEDQARAEKDALERKKREEQAAAAAATAAAAVETAKAAAANAHAQAAADATKRPNLPAIVALPPNLKQTTSNTSQVSPQAKVATPMVPKAPTPTRAKEASTLPNQQQQQGSKPHTPETNVSSSKQSSPGRVPIGQAMPFPNMPPSKTSSQQQGLPPMGGSHINHLPHMPGMIPGVGGMHQPNAGFGNPPNMPGMNAFHGSQAQMLHGMPPRIPPGQQVPMFPGQHATQVNHHHLHHHHPRGGYMHVPNPPPPPGISTTNLQSQQQLRTPFGSDPSPGGPSPSLPSSTSPASVTQPFAMAGRENLPPHSRQPSTTFESAPIFEAAAVAAASSTAAAVLPNIPAASQPIGKPPAPIKPPKPTRQDSVSDKAKSSNANVDELSNHLGSSALLDDTDEPLPANAAAPRRPSGPPGVPAAPPNDPGLIGSPFDRITSPFGSSTRPSATSSWRTPVSGFGPPGIPGPSRWSATQQTKGWGAPGAYAASGSHQRPSGNARPITVRLLACQACKALAAQSVGEAGFHEFSEVVRWVAEMARQGQEVPPNVQELRNILDTEGDTHNGGGTFHVRGETNGGGRMLVKWEPDASEVGGNVGRSSGLGLGEIGSPSIGSALPALGGMGRGY